MPIGKLMGYGASQDWVLGWEWEGRGDTQHSTNVVNDRSSDCPGRSKEGLRLRNRASRSSKRYQNPAGWGDFGLPCKNIPGVFCALQRWGGGKRQEKEQDISNDDARLRWREWLGEKSDWTCKINRCLNIEKKWDWPHWEWREPIIQKVKTLFKNVCGVEWPSILNPSNHERGKKGKQPVHRTLCEGQHCP